MNGDQRARWLIDGMNVVGSRPDGWWRDRPAAVRRLVDRLRSHAWPAGTSVTAVFDGAPVDVGDGPVALQFAPGGRGAADDLIAAAVAADPAPGEVVVVTSDRALAGRVRASGAAVLPAGALLRRLDAGEAAATAPPPDAAPAGG